MPSPTIRWRYFPRSRRPPDHLLDVVNAFMATEPKLQLEYQRWTDWLATPKPRSTAPRLESNAVLKMLEPALSAFGFDVEKSGSKLPLTVLWAENGRPEKSYYADTRIRHRPGAETVVEVEAGGATANNLWRKDLMEACLMPYVEFLVIAVRNEYRSLDSKKDRSRTNSDYQLICSELDALYESHRLNLPLEGVMIVGY